MRAWKILFPLALLVTLAQLLRGHAISWDEIEFFRATKWIGEGRVPFRDFWEHHLPLQWILFAPIARWFATGPGVSAIVILRIAQLPLWIGIVVMLLRAMRGDVSETWSRWSALTLVFSTPYFTNAALEYRLDHVGNFLYIAALVLVLHRTSATRTIAFGALMSMAVLANMRLAPLVVVTAVLILFWDAPERRWRWSPKTLAMTLGVVFVVGAFLTWLRFTGAWARFFAGVIDYNQKSNELITPIAGEGLWEVLFAPFTSFDIAAMAVWLLAFAGATIAMRGLRRPGVMQIVTILAIVSVIAVAITGVQYLYHLETAYLLMIPIGAFALDRIRGNALRLSIAGVSAIGIVMHATPLVRPSFGAPMRYQDQVMRAVDTRTSKDAVVWDGVGYALTREPAYRYWFLPAGVRLMAAAGSIERYSARELAVNPPGAIVYGMRMKYWFDSFPETLMWSRHHYVPLYRDLWIPSLSSIVEPRPMTIVWRAPAAGRYRIYSSELLARHPWLTRPDEYLAMQGETLDQMRIPLRDLPRMNDEAMQWFVDGRAILQGVEVLTLAKGSRVELRANVRVRGGVLVVPDDVTMLCLPAPENFIL